MLRMRSAGKTDDPPTSPGSGGLAPLTLVLRHLTATRAPVRPRTMPLAEAIGRVLAKPLLAPRDCPAQAIALRSGYAVRSADLVGASSYSPVWLPGEPVRVVVGQALPLGADAVLPPEAVERRGGAAEATQAIPPGQDARRVGEDAAAGTILCQAGRILGSREAACAAAAGLAEASVRPVSATLVSGDDRSGCAALVTACAHGGGASIRAVQRVDGHMRQPAERTDLLVILANDLTVIQREGNVVAAGLAIRPGDQAVCGHLDDVPVIGVPARFEAAFAVCLLMLRPFFDHLAGAAPRSGDLAGRLTRKVSSAIGLTEIVLLRAVDRGLEPLAVGDLTLSAIAAADAWLAVPPESEGYAEGSPVSAFSLRGSFG